MRRMGWKITYSDRLLAALDELPRIVPVVDVSDAPGGAFEVGYSFEAGSRKVSQSEIQGAINRGDSYLMTPNGTYLLNIGAVQEMRDVFADCSETGTASRPGHFRLPRVYAPYVRGALTSFEEVDFDDETAPSWRELSATRAKDEDTEGRGREVRARGPRNARGRAAPVPEAGRLLDALPRAERAVGPARG